MVAETGWVSSEEATAILGVRRKTLYTYASRGWVRTRRPGGRRRLYLLADLHALRRRADAHRGEAPAAAAALDWGPPVLSSAITEIDADGPNYRGMPALTLAEQDTPFEDVCARLWQDPDPAPWPAPTPAAPVDGPPLPVLLTAILSAPDDRRGLLTHALASLGATPEGALASRVAAVTGVSPDAVDAVAAALTVSADHELNASAFAARVAASTGARRPHAVLAGLATLSGPLHGGLSDRVEAWLTGRGPLPDEADGHALYPDGDPRAEHLLQRARDACPTGRRATLENKLSSTTMPNLDVGLAALAWALDARPHTAFTWFAIARMAGWIAHIDEQRASGTGPLRPRARYVGP